MSAASTQPAEYVADPLSATLGPAYAVAAVTGTLPPDERVARIEELTSQDGRRPVLVATDCLSEGVNLQEHFQAVVHYDLAWNPTRHEQREGRVDRYGQRRTVQMTMVYGRDNQIDGIVLDVLLRKHEKIRRALGISVPVPDRSDDVVEAILEEAARRNLRFRRSRGARPSARMARAPRRQYRRGAGPDLRAAPSRDAPRARRARVRRS